MEAMNQLPGQPSMRSGLQVIPRVTFYLKIPQFCELKGLLTVDSVSGAIKLLKVQFLFGRAGKHADRQKSFMTTRARAPLAIKRDSALHPVPASGNIGQVQGLCVRVVGKVSKVTYQNQMPA